MVIIALCLELSILLLKFERLIIKIVSLVGINRVQIPNDTLSGD